MKDRLTAKQKRYMEIKRKLDLIMSLGACIVLSPLLVALCIAIKLDSPGPIFFQQKRVGIHKTFFSIYKFRTMRIDTPKDTPTHLLKNPDQYITKIGHFLRKSSLDELPQLFNILKGDMSFVGPRPALWNQDDLVAEREKYGANDVPPGLTGWAQINGRDELEIPVKAKLDGIYVKRMSFWFDVRCFVGTFASVFSAKGVVEGTHEAEQEEDADCFPRYEGNAKRVAIIGEHSYIGTSFYAYVKQYAPEIDVTLVGAKNGEWKSIDFGQYDAVLHAAAIVHQKEKRGMERLYETVNARLPLAVAKKAKKSGVKKFVFLSTMAVYGKEQEMIDKSTKERPATLYARSKRKAEKGLERLADASFQVTALRPPMVYGAGCPGNYGRLKKFSNLLFVFPQTKNQRSMIYIENLCAVILAAVQEENDLPYQVVCPQNAEYVVTSDLVKEIRKAHGKRTLTLPGMNGLLRLGARKSDTVQKVFGNCCYEKEPLPKDFAFIGFEESIRRTENAQ